MSGSALGAERIEALRSAGNVETLELYLKRGRSRRFVRIAGLEQSSEASESGWAVRASTDRGSFFRCGTGQPETSIGWPEPDGQPIRLPEPQPVPPWQAPPEIEAPLASESEIKALVTSIEKELRRARPDAKVDHLVLEDGQSQSWIGSTEGMLASWRGRAASLVVEVSAGASHGGRVRLEAIQREVRELAPRQLARRLVDLLTVLVEGRPVLRDRSEVVVAPRVGSRLVAGLWPLFDPGRSESVIDAIATAGKIGGPALTIIDDGRLRQGVLAAPVDGEGTPTQEVVLVDEGVFRQPLLGWWMGAGGRRSGGCSQRFSWRDEPRIAPTHLYLKPDPAVRATDLVGSLSRGYYLLDSASEGHFDFAADRFSLPVRGFEMLGGRAKSPVARVALVGRISALLAGVRAVARDLAFAPTSRGLFGAPTIRLGGLEIRQQR